MVYYFLHIQQSKGEKSNDNIILAHCWNDCSLESMAIEDSGFGLMGDIVNITCGLRDGWLIGGS
jgi:hypothetical protein